MRLAGPRIPPLQDNELESEQRLALDAATPNGPARNIFRTLAHAPEALARFREWTVYVLSPRNALSARQREIIILRTAFLCGAGYAFTQHTAIGLQAGLSAAEIAALKLSPDAAHWSDSETALLRASDELHADQFVTDSTWAALQRHFDQKQCMDAVFTAAQYTQLSMIVNSFGVPLDPGQTLDPDLRRF